MDVYAIKFKYDDGYENSRQICLVFASNSNQAKSVFQENIYTIFNGNDDICEIEEIIKVPNPNLLFLQRGTMWATSNGTNNSKMIW